MEEFIGKEVDDGSRKAVDEGGFGKEVDDGGKEIDDGSRKAVDDGIALEVESGSGVGAPSVTLTEAEAEADGEFVSTKVVSEPVVA